MKKVITFLITVSVVFCIASSTEKPAEAQYVVYSRYCCDGFGNVRCVINPTPLGNPCYCYGQGAGYTC